MRPDFVGTLEGVSGMMREMNEQGGAMRDALVWRWGWNESWGEYVCHGRRLSDLRIDLGHIFSSPEDRPGDCVGDAYLSVKEASDANTTD